MTRPYPPCRDVPEHVAALGKGAMRLLLQVAQVELLPCGLVLPCDLRDGVEGAVVHDLRRQEREGQLSEAAR